VIDTVKFPNTKECDEFAKQEISTNIMISIIVAISIVFVIVLLFQTSKVYSRF
jgi:hypothetical protein